MIGKYCPILKHCMTNKCAWYDGMRGQCVMATIADKL